VHGSPLDPARQYIMSEPAARANFSAFAEQVCFFAHTHVPRAFILQNAEVVSFYFSEDMELVLDKNLRYLVNPGSVGQPRDGDPRAAYMLFNLKKKCLTLHRVKYDPREAQKRIRRAGLPEYLAERLDYGR